MESDKSYQRIRIFKIKRNLKMFKRNYIELIEHLAFYQNSTSRSSIWNHANGNCLDDFISEAERLLINFVSLAMAIKDCNRILIREGYSDSEFLQKYQNEIDKRFTNNDLVQFVEGFRNCVLHCTTPILNAEEPTTNVDKQPINKCGLHLYKPRLLDSCQWRDTKGENFIRQQPDNIDIRPIVDEYYDIIDKFYNWLFTELEK